MNRWAVGLFGVFLLAGCSKTPSANGGKNGDWASISPEGQKRVITAREELNSIQLAVVAFRLDANRFPTQEEGLEALTTAPPGIDSSKLHEPYLEPYVPLDPWGRPYVYESPDKTSKEPDSFRVYSLGADGKPGGVGEDADIFPKS